MSVSLHELACLISRHSAHDRRQSGLIFNRQGKDWDKATTACKHSGNGQFNDMLKSRQLNNSNRHTAQGVSGGICHTPKTFLRCDYIDINKNIYFFSLTITELMARYVFKNRSSYTFIHY